MRIFAVFVVSFLGTVCLGVRAQGLDLGSVNYGTPARGGTLVGGAITVSNPSAFTRVIQVGATAGDVVVRDGIVTRVGSADVSMVLSRAMPWQSVTNAAAVLGRTLPYVATAIAFIDLMDVIRLRSDGTTWRQDPGTAQTPQTQWASRGINGVPFTYHANPAAAMQAHSVAAMGSGSCRFGSSLWSGPTYVVTSSTSAQVYFTARATVRSFASNSACTGTSSSSVVDTSLSDIYAVTQTSCPASVDALNPANSLPAGLPVGPDGLCRTGRYTDAKTNAQAAEQARLWSTKANAAAAVGSLLNRGNDIAPYTDTPTASGPASVAQPGTTTTSTGPNGTTTGTSTPTSIITYNGPTYISNDSTVVTTTTGGSTTTTTTTAPPAPEVQTCGLPGRPACKIDETGTPATIPPYATGPIDDTKITDATKQTTEIGRVIDPGFGWFAVPPMATCAPIAWPGGVQINPCNGIEVVRSIMAYLWALYGAVWSFGVFRRSLPGAA